jgi:hypothetical protein
MGLARCVACVMGEMLTEFGLENLNEVGHLEDLAIGGMIILISILHKLCGAGLNVSSQIGTMACFCEHGNEASGSVQRGHHLDWLSHC